MKQFDYTIKDELGIHVRPAGMLAKEGKKFASSITMCYNGKANNITKLMAIMSMGIKQGNTVSVTVEGEDEDLAYEAIKSFLENNL